MLARRLLVLVCLSLTPCAAASAQVLDAKGVPITFEAISVKESSGNRISDGWQGARFTAGDVPLRNFLSLAYGIPFHETTSLPEWTRRTTYLIRAVATRAPEPSEQALFMRAILEARFGVIARTEMQEQPMYSLVRARTDGRLGANLKPSSVDCLPLSAAGQPTGKSPANCAFNADFAGGIYTRTGVALPVLTDALSIILQRPVVDRTDLTGTFDIDLKFRPVSAAAADANADQLPDIVTAVEEQLGLKLEAGRGSFPTTVFDRLERPLPD